MKTGFPIHNPIPIQRDPRSEKSEQDQQIREAAKLYEKRFLHEMVEAMRKTVDHSSLTEPTMAEKIYQDDMYEQYVDKWSDSGGVGLADVIYDQIKSKINLMENGAGERPQGPLPIDQKNQPLKIPVPGELKIETQKSSEPNQAAFLFRKSQIDVGSYPVLAPWNGKVVDRFQTPEGRSVLRLDHGQGLQSKISFVGSALSHLTDVRAGQVIGAWAPEGQSLSWQIDKKST